MTRLKSERVADDNTTPGRGDGGLMVAALVAAYFISTQLSFRLVSPEFGLAAFWPAAGVLAGGLAILSPSERRWLLGTVFAIVLLPNVFEGAPFARALVFAAANCLEGAIFVAFYHHGRWEPQVRTPRDMAHFLAAGIFACILAAAAGSLGLRYLANGDQNLTSWLFWVLADFVGIFAVTPVLFFLRKPAAARRISREAAIALAGGIGAVAMACFFPFPASWMQIAPLGIAAPFVLWCAIRGSIFANALLTLAITILAILATTYDLGPFAHYSPLTYRILATQLFILRACGGSVLLSVLFEDRRRRESQLRTIVDTVPVGLILTEGSSGRVIGGNRYVEELMGHDVLSSTDLSALGRSRAFDRNDDPVDHRHLPWARLAGEEAEKPALDVNYRRDDGSYIWLRLLGRQVRDAGGASVGNVFALVNIDEEKKAWARVQTEVDNLQIRLMQTSRASAMGTMASALAHELNQPLTAVVNYLQAARRIMATNPADGAEQLGGAIETAESCALRAGEIIRRLRGTLSRGDAETSSARVVDLVEESIAMACPLRGNAPASFELDIAPGLCVEVDGVQIQQVLINLITNALEAMEGCAVRKIVIAARRRARMVEISVTDSGPGFAQSVRDKLFEPFVSTKDYGMGVGLSICRTIVERHGGRIHASEGLPTRIAMILPAAARAEKLAA
jgi:two-component system, LuxR family, sensor kinase FixL